MNFTPFESDLVKWFVENCPDWKLCEQLRLASLVSRQYTGAGVFLDLSIQPGLWEPLREITTPINGPRISSPELEHGAGSLLFFSGGVASMLEVFTYSDEMAKDICEYEFRVT